MVFGNNLPSLPAGEEIEPLRLRDVVLGNDSTLKQRLQSLHAEMRRQAGLAGIDRIAVAAYDPRSDLVKTFLESSYGQSPQGQFWVRLEDSPALRQLAAAGTPMVVDRLDPDGGTEEFGRRVAAMGFRSRYVVPMTHGDTLIGFQFFNSRKPGYFTPKVLDALTPHRRLVHSMVVGESLLVRTMLAAVRTVLAVSYYRDEETGGHLERMAHYARLVASRLADRNGLSDEFVEYVYLYAPLHDIGKVAVPDTILLKPSRLTPEEFAVMQTHVVKGEEIIDGMFREFGMLTLPHATVLRNVVSCHHEAMDGSGYPRGLMGDAIPLEGRVSAVADVFDALTSHRPYKPAWSNREAEAMLREMAGTKLDPQCVEALLSCMDEVIAIQEKLQDPDLGTT